MIKHVVALSGGKDSTALALRLKELNPGVSYDFVCTPTGDELPGMQDHWKRLEDRLGEIKYLPTETLYDLIKRKKMIPNFRARFCTQELKLFPFFTYMESLPPGSIMYVGIRKDEEDRLGAVLAPDDEFVVEKPFIGWGWGMSHVTAYLACEGVTIPKRTDCGACFFQRLGEWRDLWKEHPDRYQKYVDIEEEMGHTFRSPGRDTWPASLKELREEFKTGRKIRERKTKDPGIASCPWCSK